jgi:hypothetical protein
VRRRSGPIGLNLSSRTRLGAMIRNGEPRRALGKARFTTTGPDGQVAPEASSGRSALHRSAVRAATLVCPPLSKDIRRPCASPSEHHASVTKTIEGYPSRIWEHWEQTNKALIQRIILQIRTYSSMLLHGNACGNRAGISRLQSDMNAPSTPMIGVDDGPRTSWPTGSSCAQRGAVTLSANDPHA